MAFFGANWIGANRYGRLFYLRISDAKIFRSPNLAMGFSRHDIPFSIQCGPLLFWRSRCVKSPLFKFI